MSADLLDEWIARVGHMRERAEKAERQVADVRALHQERNGLCVGCDEQWVDQPEYPCPTIRALDPADEVNR